MKKINPIIYVITGVLVLLLAGFIYAWSVISAPIAQEFGKQQGEIALAFTTCMAFFCLGGMANSFILNKLDGKWMFRIAAVLFILGFFLTSRITSLVGLYIFYGVICGIASGFAYNTVMGTVPRWYPHRQALVSGTLLMGFGLSTLIVGGVFSAITPDTVGAWRTSLMIMGIVLGVVIFLASFILRRPTAEEEAALPKVTQPGTDVATEDVPPQRMLGSIIFWLFFIWEVLLSAAGLYVIQQARNLAIGAEASLESKLGTIALLVGAISVCNGLGRVIFGAIFDRKGRKFTMVIVSIVAIAATAAIALALSKQTIGFMVVAFMLLGLSYGGGPVMSAAFTKSQFGTKYFATNFSIMTLCLLVASLGAQLITSLSLVKVGGEVIPDFLGISVPIVIGCMAAAVIIAFILPSKKGSKN